MTQPKNGCLPGDRQYTAGTFVRVMPRKLAQIAATRADRKIGSFYTENDDTLLRTSNYIAEIMCAGPGGYQVRPLASAAWTGTIPACCIFGPAYDIGDVVEVGLESEPDNPPVRRLFIGYAFDYEFNPVVRTYSASDTLAVLEDLNTAVVDIEDSETWDYLFPEEQMLKALPPRYDVQVAVNGEPKRIRELSATQWMDIYNSAG